ncbi:MAG: prolyl oligopeptidase family serine peptidase [Clostridia bacterium]|nr:prolyl oligopeptidase family serine peptidase [Clostridia bacterium]
MKIEQGEYKKLKYVISYPNGYKDGEQYPVIFHTHGAGSRGTDLSLLNINVPICNNPSADNFIIVAPQCYADTWFEIFEQLIEFCEYIHEQPFTDKTKFYSSGISMGGYTAYQLMMSRPHLFTAGIVCCGGGMYWNASRLKDIPLRIFHGKQDKTVLPCESKNMAEYINSNGGCATLTLYPECAHNCWDKVYTNKENFDWLLSQYKE